MFIFEVQNEGSSESNIKLIIIMRWSIYIAFKLPYTLEISIKTTRVMPSNKGASFVMQHCNIYLRRRKRV